MALLTGTAACTSSAEAGEAATPTAEVTQAGSTVPFGRPYQYGDGLFVLVKEPQEFEPSREAQGVDEGVPVRVRVQVTNGTRRSYTPSTLEATAMSGGAQATQVVDLTREIDAAGPYVTLDPGQTVSFDLAFAVADPDDVTVTVAPALGGYEPLVVTTD
ncbi:hypothetical protein [Cellulomonas sp. JZ18]|uniref:hypothetical protein n=1 Tax=Cellulomonas sp. JZ18 TaxID=2654191 RepID=UPI0012D3ED8C|nr:hypothetical protein [Cellulomonas sp. JZ18]